MKSPEFDDFADNYDRILKGECALSGESPEFYAVERMRWCLRRLRPWLPLDAALDFGCGTGSSIRHFFEILGCTRVIAIDPSMKSLGVAQRKVNGLNVEFATPEEFAPSSDLSLVFCNGVFHHIDPPDRLRTLGYLRSALGENGILAFWENNPWNPVVTYSMSRSELDKNAVTISPREAIRLLEAARFKVQFTDFCFFFPHFARRFRRLEPALRWLPVGAQYLVVARK